MVLFLSSGPLILDIKDVKKKSSYHEKTTFYTKTYYPHFLKHYHFSVNAFNHEIKVKITVGDHNTVIDHKNCHVEILKNKIYV